MDKVCNNITITIGKSFNLYELHNLLVTKITDNYNVRKAYIEEQRKLYSVFISESHRTKIAELDTQLSSLISREMYENETKEILNIYKDLDKSTFVGQRHKQLTPTINEYLNIAREYFDIVVQYEYEKPPKLCINCNKDVSNIATGRCECGVTIIKFARKSKDNKEHVREDDHSEGFLEIIERLEGTFATDIPKAVYDKLNEHFAGRKFTKKLVKKTYADEELVVTEGTNVRMLLQALKDTNNSKYYNDVHLIGHTLFDWKLPVLSRVKQLMIQHFRVTQPYYNQFKGQRSSNISMWSRCKFELIYLHAIGVIKVLYTNADFKVVNDNTEDEYNTIFRQMYKAAGLISD